MESDTSPRDLYGILGLALSEPGPESPRPWPQTTFTATIETIDNDREGTGLYPSGVLLT